MMEKLGQTLDSKQYWTREANQYTDALKNDYHAHRLEVIRALIPSDLFRPDQRIFDFGCGDAILFPWFLETGGKIEGIDISPEMIALGKQQLAKWGEDEALIQVADVQFLKSLPSASMDGILSFNVLAYLTDEEEITFYQEASRIVKPGGYLVVTHSNSLFDMFSLNHYTINFFKENFVLDADFHSQLANLIKHSETTSTTYNVRENPLSYCHKLASFGFKEVRQEFINLHPAPPSLLHGKDYPSTLNVTEEHRWKLMFMCSTYGSCSVRL
jgi:SAM-dependent methyltransferase